MDCGEIQRATGQTGAAIRFNNVNKILKRYPALATRLEARGERVRYRISDAGRTYLRMVEPQIATQKNDEA